MLKLAASTEVEDDALDCWLQYIGCKQCILKSKLMLFRIYTYDSINDKPSNSGSNNLHVTLLSTAYYSELVCPGFVSSECPAVGCACWSWTSLHMMYLCYLELELAYDVIV